MKHLLWKPIICVLVTLAFVSACQFPVAPPPRSPVSPSPTSIPPADRVSEEGFRVEISLTGSDGRAGISTFIGANPSIKVVFRPTKDVVTTKKDGTISKYSTDWNPHTATQMKYCTGVGRACSLPDAWVPFVMEQTVRVDVDWIGDKDWAVSAQFRDVTGQLIPAGYMKNDVGSNWLVISSEINDSVPPISLPPAVQTTIAQARGAYPVTGGIKINQGRPMGGKSGLTLQIPVEFTATSPVSPVSEMRIKTSSIGRCLSPEEMQDASWQLYQERMSFPYKITGANWTTFKLHVQFRDNRGNLSMIYCHDIGIEGNP